MKMAGGLAPPLTEQAHDIDQIWDGVLLAAVIVGVLVIGLIGFVVWRFRRRDDRLPFQRRENIPIEVTYMVVPLLVVGALFGITFFSVRFVDEVHDDPDLTVTVTGFQWQWQFDYPESGVRIVGSEVKEPELVLPTGAKVQFDLTSVDVIHSFWIPGFRFKRDMFPGQTQTFQVDIGDLTGSWPDSGVCAEYCGLDHHKMRFSVRIVTPDEFRQWLQEAEG
jgi:cytochrome c oxidase subunit II